MDRTIVWWLSALFVLHCLPSSQGTEDERCRCVCPELQALDSLRNQNLSSSLLHKSVYIKKQVEPQDCVCEDIVTYILPAHIMLHIDDLGEFCLRCQCQFEQRNSTTQKVVIIFVIVVFALMLCYGIFLTCLDPLLNRKRNLSYTRQLDDRVETDDAPISPTTARQTMGLGGSGPVTQAVNRVRQQQERWKGQVSEQRSNIYQKHKILA